MTLELTLEWIIAFRPSHQAKTELDGRVYDRRLIIEDWKRENQQHRGNDADRLHADGRTRLQRRDEVRLEHECVAVFRASASSSVPSRKRASARQCPAATCGAMRTTLRYDLVTTADLPSAVRFRTGHQKQQAIESRTRQAAKRRGNFPRLWFLDRSLEPPLQAG